jgi:PhnB protein
LRRHVGVGHGRASYEGTDRRTQVGRHFTFDGSPAAAIDASSKRRQQEIDMADNPKMPNPPVKGGAVPYLTVDGAIKAAEFYQKAFAAEVATIYPPDAKGRTMHAHVYINGASVMFSDAYPEHGHPLQAPAAFNIMLRVDDIDAWYKRAVDAGCTATMPPADMFWGDRYGQLKDPFGVTWALNTPIKK